MTITSPAMPTTIHEVFEPLSNQVIDIHRRWSLFRQTYATSESRIALLNRHGGDWFGYAQVAMYDDLILALFRLIDPAEQGKGKNLKQNLTVERLANVVREEGQLGLFTTLMDCLGRSRAFLQLYEDWRNKRTAHNDLARMQAFWRGDHTSSGPSYSTIGEVLAEVAKCLNVIGVNYGGAEVRYDGFIHTNGQDGEALIGHLERYEEELAALKDDAPTPELREVWPTFRPSVRKGFRPKAEGS